MSKEKKVIASWSLDLNCECPYCEENIDLLHDILDFTEWLVNLEIDVCQSKDNLKIEITCPKCDKDFIIEEVQY